MTNLQFVKCKSVKDVQSEIMICQENGHVQQVAYSTYHTALTQICFGCKKIRSNIELPKKQEEKVDPNTTF